MFGKLELRDKMRDSWLIQRLEKSRERVSPFAFGGGLINGGFSKGAMNCLKNIFSFAYMGSAEFEFGAVPEAFCFLAQQSKEKKLVIGEIDKVYYISPKQYEKEVKNRITSLRKNEYKLNLKEYCGLQSYFENNEHAKDYVGWIEIDNGFMFFVNKEVFDKMCRVFELTNI